MYFHVLCGFVIFLMMTLDTLDFTVRIQRYSLMGPPNWVINLIKSRSSRMFMKTEPAASSRPRNLNWLN